MLADGLGWADPTDIRLANEFGMAAALVLTGATTLDEALSSGDRPEYVIEDLGELLPREDGPRAVTPAPDRRRT